MMETRGYTAVGLDNPKTSENIASALRACSCYGAKMIAVSGKRYQRSKIDTPKTFRHIPFIQTENLKQIIPYSCVPVAVELVEEAKDLREFKHPESAFYIFGREDGNICDELLDICEEKVYIPTRVCMNLAATVNVVLYDRMLKRK